DDHGADAGVVDHLLPVVAGARDVVLAGHVARGLGAAVAHGDEVDVGQRPQSGDVSLTGVAAGPDQADAAGLRRHEAVAKGDRGRHLLLGNPTPGCYIRKVARVVVLSGRAVMRQLFVAAVATAALAVLAAAPAQAGKVEVKGLHICCGQCEKGITTILGKIDGVTEAKPNKDPRSSASSSTYYNTTTAALPAPSA